MEEYRNQYKFYKKHVPPTASTLFEQSSYELDQIRRAVLNTHRIVALTDFLVRPKKDNMIKYPLSKKFKPRAFVLNPTILTMQNHLNPFLVQQATSLFNNIYQNTSIIVDSLLLYSKSVPSFDSFSLSTFIDNLKNPKQRSPIKRPLALAASSSHNSLKEFNFLATSAIPSLFGYFSSNEHINLSMPFFVKVISSTDCFPLITVVLAPFFSAPCLYRFFESSLTPFFDSFIRDTQKFTKNVIQEYGKHLTAHFSSKTELIPHTHVVLLRMMFAKFGEIATSNFFQESILRPQVIQWQASISTKIPKELDLIDSDSKNSRLKSKLKDDEQISYEIIRLIFEEIDSHAILQSVLKSESLIEPPFQYTVFEDPFLYFLTSISDLRALYHLFIKTVTNPSSFFSMKIFDTEDVDENSVFFFRTYPSHQLKTQLSRNALIFPNYTIKVPRDDRKERQWRAIENLAEEQEISPMSIVKELERKSKGKSDFDDNENNYQTITVTNPNISDKEMSEFVDYALISTLKHLTNSADVFEQFLIQMNDLRQSKEWLSISLLHEHAALLPIAKEIALQKEKKYGTDMFKSHSNFLYVFEKASMRIQSKSILRFQYLFIVQRFIKKLIGEFDKDFEKVKEKITDIFQRNIQSLDSLNTNLNPTRSTIFWEAVELFRTAQCDDLPYQFSNLMRSLDLLYSLGTNTRMNFNYNTFVEEPQVDSEGEINHENDTVKRFLTLALSLSFSHDIFYLYMVLSLFAMSNETFRSFCSEHEQRLWVIFQNVMLNMTSDEEVSQVYTEITSRIAPQ